MTATPRFSNEGKVAATGQTGAESPPRPAGLLVVGDAGFADSVRQVLKDEGITAPIKTVPDYLMALGEAATQPPAVVLGRVHNVDDMLDSSLRGLRSLLPHGRLLLVVAPAEEPVAVQAVRCGFNDYLIEPLDTQELARLVRAGLEAQAATPGDRGFRFPSPPVTPPAALNPPSVAPGTGEVKPTPAAPVSPAVPDAELGDVDLVAALINDPTGIVDLALRLIGASSGIAGLSWSAPAAPPPEPASPGATPAGAGARVVYEGTSLGFLNAPAPAKPEDLAPWASWLGHWLALDRTMKDLREAAAHDDLTGVWNRRYFRHFLTTVLERAVHERFCVTLMIFDIDNFKSYNDRYGHPSGDQILRETARLMQSVVRSHDVVARIGGDEFAVVFWDAEEPRKPNSRHPHSVRRAAERFQKAICSHKFPRLLSQNADSLTISGGLAGFPWDGRAPDDLIAFADAKAMESKRQGKNALTFGPGAAGNGGTEQAV